MPRGHTSRIFHEPCPDGRQRDIFPLPALRNVGAVQGFVCRAAKKRIHRRQQVTSRVNQAIRSLNSLFFGGDGTGELVVDSLQSLPLSQRLCIRDLIKKVRAFGSCPTGASNSEALKVNMAFREPPRCELGSLAAMCNLEIPEGLEAMKSDLSGMGFFA